MIALDTNALVRLLIEDDKEQASVLTFPNPDVISWAIKQYRKGGDFADLVISQLRG